MRHQNNTAKLSLKAGPRKALLRNLATSLIEHGRMETTIAKAKTIKPIIEKFITLSKKDTLTVRRALLAYFNTEKVVNKLLKEVGPKYLARKGGYTRVTKLGVRKGDNAEMAVIELV